MTTANEVPRLSRSLPDMPPQRLSEWSTSVSATSPGPSGLVHKPQSGCRPVGYRRLHWSPTRHRRRPRSPRRPLHLDHPQRRRRHFRADRRTLGGTCRCRSRGISRLPEPAGGCGHHTVTEAAYLRGADGHLDAGLDVIVSDLEALRSDPRNPVASLPARLVAGLVARRTSGASALTILSCDNLPENGAVTKTVVQDFAALLDETLGGWIDSRSISPPRWWTESPRALQTRIGRWCSRPAGTSTHIP